MVKKVDSVVECIECTSNKIVIDKDKNEVICRNCGAIFEPLLPEEEAKLERVRGFGFTKHKIVKGLFDKFKKK